MSRKANPKPRGMTVSIEAPSAERVCVAGDFNGWNPTATPMRRQRDERWVAVLDLVPGLHEYKFVIDGRWCCADHGDSFFDGRPGHVPNAHGTMNLVVVIPGAEEFGFDGLARF
ncbi:MAG: hypothetical protein GIKADHBN_02262 [Phycisphaerales bacterium]|nr:hypothetical protein [Phycisphaerales bacterium]